MNTTIIEDAVKEINYKYGESVSTLILDGKIHRAGEKDHVWYVGHEWNYKNSFYQTINYGSWRLNDSFTVKSWDADKEREKGFKKCFTEHTREAKAKLDAEKAANHEACRKKCAPIFAGAKKNVLHEYLEFKSIANSFISRIDQNGVLLIPAYKPIKNLVGFQRIYRDPATNKFNKKFAFGIEITGAFCPLSPFKDAEYAYLSEGYATASSIQEAFPNIPSICVFNAGNISPAINSIRFINPKIKIIIAADKDPKSKAGEFHAKKATKSFGSVIYKLPSFSVDNPSWTDFNDLHAFESLDKVKSQLSFDESDFITITCLGYMDNHYYYTSTTQKQIIQIAASSHNKLNLYSIAPLEFWKKNYGVEVEGVLVVPWDSVFSDLMDQCKSAGLYDPEKVRGVGVWEDNKNFVINDGQDVFNEPKDSTYFYQKIPKKNYSIEAPLTDDEMKPLLSSFKELPYKNKNDYIYTAAWIIQAQIYSVMDWRFHVWLTGEKGSGKSTVLDWIGKLLIHPVLTSDATAAGIIQELRNNARPIIYDESEASNKIDPVIELARRMSSNNGNKTLRGSSAGKVVSSNTNTVFLMGSIQVSKLNSADRSRFFIVNMEKSESESQEHYENAKHDIEIFITMKERIFARAYQCIPSIKQSTKTIRKFLMDKKLEARYADQLSACLACFWVYYSTEPITTEEADNIIHNLDLLSSDYTEQNKETDQDDCLDTLMQLIVDRDNTTLKRVLEITKSLSNDKTQDYCEKVLGSFGIRYFPENDSMFIGKNANNLIKEMGARGFPAFLEILKRDKKRILKASDRQRVTGFGNKEGIRISVKEI
jgi:putative DNA primase/helicase